MAIEDRFGPSLKRARENAGLSVSALARAAGTSRAAVHAYETGARSPSLGTAERLLACCGYALEITSVDARNGDADVVLSVLRGAISSAAVKPLHASIFGSVARGTEGPGSDVDLLVVYPTFASESEKAELDKLMVEMVFSVDRAVDRDLRTLRLSQERLRRLALSGSMLLVDVMSEGRTVWGPPLRDMLALIVLAAGGS